MMNGGIPYSKIIIDNYLYLPAKEIPDINSLKKELTICSRFDNKKIFKLYTAYKEWFGVPLYHYQNLDNIAEKVIDKRVIGNDVKFNFISTFWPGQKELIDDFFKYYCHGRTGFIIEAKTGSGKTVCTIATLSRIGKRVLIIVPRSNLVNQWVDSLLKHSDLSKKDIGTINGSDVVWKNKKVVVGLVHSLALDRLEKEFKNNFGVVVFDEVHSSVPPITFAPVATLCNAKIRIAMSATLERADGLHEIFNEHIGQVYLKGNITKRMPAKVLLHYFSGSSGELYSGMKKLNRRGMLLSKLAKNTARNLVIIKYIKLMLKSNRRILVLSDRTWQLVFLAGMLYADKDIDLNKNDVGYFVNTLSIINEKTGKVDKKKVLTKKDREHTASVCKVILATFGMFALGSDIQNLSGLIYATPQSCAEQAQGRIERFLVGKKQPAVVDIIDTHYKDTMGWATSRQSFYKRNGVEVKVV